MWAVIYNQDSEVSVDVFAPREEEKAHKYASLMKKQGYTVRVVWASDLTNVPISG